MNETIAAISTGNIPSAIGIIRLSGENTLSICSKILFGKGEFFKQEYISENSRKAIYCDLVDGNNRLDKIVFVFFYPKYTANTVFAILFGVVYVSVMISAVYTTRGLPLGNYLVWLIFISSWGSDTCAYCVGVLFGNRL